MPNPGPDALCGDSRYMWNENIFRDVIAQQIGAYWCTPLIQGYVDMQEIDGNDFKLITIARRRWKMGGTRYSARGVNDDGDVSNYTEVE